MFFTIDIVIRGIFQLPHRTTGSWQDVTITGIGTFRIPSKWNVEEQEGILFITDRQMSDGDYTIYIVGTYRGSEIRPYEVFDGVKRGERLSLTIHSNFGDFSLNEYTINGRVQEHHSIHLQNDIGHGNFHAFDLFIWNRDIVNEWHVRQISRTFRSCRIEFDYANLGQLSR